MSAIKSDSSILIKFRGANPSGPTTMGPDNAGCQTKNLNRLVTGTLSSHMMLVSNQRTKVVVVVGRDFFLSGFLCFDSV